ncbi:MAG: nucleotidyl transferase AbiEii/AbiGii toxin family protein [Kiritimatiellae bacterium]|nr:nucleotidyl transferase AbiEii/AbiGii toxin family protein [Kiritimatiellia bacterium]
METKSIKTPNSRRHLDMAIQRAYGAGNALTEARKLMANVVAGQFLPEGVVKGGSSIRLRYGTTATRFTFDLDTAWKSDLDVFLKAMKKNAREGWSGFTAEIIAKRPASPQGIPFDYIMQPFDVKLSYRGQSWCTVELEVGYNEIGDADEPDLRPVANDISEMFTRVGLPIPGPLPLMPVEYQIAQKLHGLTSTRANRPHDLTDLQIIAHNSKLDFDKLIRTCTRLFTYRKQQPWPPKLDLYEDWRDAYNEWADLDGVKPTLEEAVTWANDFISRINSAE